MCTDPRMKCPNCGFPDCRADFVDIGVGEEQCGPYVCEPDLGGCGWVQPNSPEIELPPFDDERPFG
jgi:hypothetical protein